MAGLSLAAELGKPEFDARVLQVLADVPRHLFVPEPIRAHAYLNMPLPIGFGKTTSQPFIVALMTDLLQPAPGDRVLEVGTGLGYHAAVLSRLVVQVFSVEIIADLQREAKQRLKRQGVRNVGFKLGDGRNGWPEHAPFDKILVAAASDLVPATLLHQLASPGRMVVPTGSPEQQSLLLVTKEASGRIVTHEILPVRFAMLSGPEDEDELEDLPRRPS